MLFFFLVLQMLKKVMVTELIWRVSTSAKSITVLQLQATMLIFVLILFQIPYSPIQLSAARITK
jgi:hypothetical protein